MSFPSRYRGECGSKFFVPPGLNQGKERSAGDPCGRGGWRWHDSGCSDQAFREVVEANNGAHVSGVDEDDHMHRAQTRYDVGQF